MDFPFAGLNLLQLPGAVRREIAGGTLGAELMSPPARSSSGSSHASQREDFERALATTLEEGATAGHRFLDVRAGDLHRRVGGYPGPSHRMPVCCSVMLTAMSPTTTFSSSLHVGREPVFRLLLAFGPKQAVSPVRGGETTAGRRPDYLSVLRTPWSA